MKNVYGFRPYATEQRSNGNPIQAGTKREPANRTRMKTLIKIATPVNLRGKRKGDAISVRGGKIICNLPAYAPASFVLDL